MEKEFEIKKELQDRRKQIKDFDALTKYLKDIEENYNCGYGEAPRAIAQASLAVAWYLSNKFGITGLQAGRVMWDFIRDWNYTGNKCGLKIVDYDNMLFPQYDYKFEKTISQEVFSALQEEAKKKLETKENVHPEVLLHWTKIANGEVPFGYTVSND
jgi:hypothetical protein